MADDISVDAARVRRFDVVLEPGRPDQTSSVQDEAPMIETAGGTVNTVLDRRIWAQAPAARVEPSVLPVAVTAAGVQGNHDGLSISGLSSRDAQTYAVDGVPQDTLSAPEGHPEFFETIAVTTANPAAGQYRAASLGMTSRRGVETFHGGAYYRFGASALNASSYFATYKKPYSLSEAGGEVGGRVWKERTFVFAGWVHQQNPYTQTLYAEVPTELMRNRDFSQYLSTQTSPTGNIVVIRDPRTGIPFPGNVIPSNRINAVSTSFITTYVPTANRGDANTFSQNYSWSHPFANGPFRTDWPFFRLDQKLWGQNHAFVRFLEVRTGTVAAGSLGEQLNSTQSRVYRSVAVSDTQALGASAANNLTIGLMGNHVRQGEEEKNVSPLTGDSVISATGLQGVNIAGYQTAGFPTMTIAGITGLSMAYAGGMDKSMAQNDGAVTFEDSLVWSKGRHVFQFGAQYLYNTWRQGAVPQSVYGNFVFSGELTGVGFADFLLGVPATSSRQNPRTNRSLHQNQGGLYFSDSLRLTRKLTIDFGVRQDLYGTPVYDDGYMYNWNPDNGHVIVAPGTLTAVSSLYPKSIVVETGAVAPKVKRTNVRRASPQRTGCRRIRWCAAHTASSRRVAATGRAVY